MSDKVFGNDLVARCKDKVTLTLNKPAYIVMCILALSKVLMHESDYVYIKNTFGNDSRLLFTDTNSLTYEINNEDVYEGFCNDKEMFDFSNSSTKSKYYDNSNKLVICKMKDETDGAVIEKIVGLKPKVHSYLVNDNSEH